MSVFLFQSFYLINLSQDIFYLFYKNLLTKPFEFDTIYRLIFGALAQLVRATGA